MCPSCPNSAKANKPSIKTSGDDSSRMSSSLSLRFEALCIVVVLGGIAATVIASCEVSGFDPGCAGACEGSQDISPEASATCRA